MAPFRPDILALRRPVGGIRFPRARTEMQQSRVQLIVTCMLVMGCGNIERCRATDRLLLKLGYERRYANEDGDSCTRKFVREHDSGSAGELLDGICREVEEAISPEIHDWKAFIHVGGRETAWATLEAGKPPLRGTLDLPRR
jgi:hypothetical protein